MPVADQLEAELAAAVARMEVLETAARVARRELLGELVDDEARAIARRRYEAQVVIDQGVDDDSVAAAKAELEKLPKSWALPTADGAYAQVIVVRASSWLRAVRDWATGDGLEVLKAGRLGPKSVIAVAEHDAARADRHTGRDVTTSHATVAKALGFHRDTVRDVRRLLRRNGWQAEIERGRYLRKAEREIASDVHGGSQWRAASVRALTVPSREIAAAIAADETQHAEQVRAERRQAQQRRRVCRRAPAQRSTAGGHTARVSTPLPPSGKSSQLFSSSVVPNARNARGTRSTTSQENQPHSRAAHRLAARLLADIAISKIRSAHTAPLVRAVAPLADAGWTAYDVKSAIDQWHRDHDRLAVPVAAQRNPLGLLIHQIRTSCAPNTVVRRTRPTRHRRADTEIPGVGTRKPANFAELVDAAHTAHHFEEVNQ